MFGNQFSVARDVAAWEDWRRTLDKRTRKEIERCWRVFHRSPVARFEHAADPVAALALFEALEEQQSQRMQALGTPYRLDAPECRAFYRQVIQGGMANKDLNRGPAAPGSKPAGARVVMTALRDGEHVVSALFGLANAHRYLGLRQSLGGDAWKACSPARLLDEETARQMHTRGCEHFDFGIGDYHHKHALQMRSIPLLDACAALSWRGLLAVAAWRTRAWIKQHPRLLALLRRCLRRSTTH
jgi:CelD/BcsL family acetyltransferase involved in cellulose biosynthesis